MQESTPGALESGMRESRESPNKDNHSNQTYTDSESYDEDADANRPSRRHTLQPPQGNISQLATSTHQIGMPSYSPWIPQIGSQWIEQQPFPPPYPQQPHIGMYGDPMSQYRSTASNMPLPQSWPQPGPSHLHPSLNRPVEKNQPGGGGAGTSHKDRGTAPQFFSEPGSGSGNADHQRADSRYGDPGEQYSPHPGRYAGTLLAQLPPPESERIPGWHFPQRPSPAQDIAFSAPTRMGMLYHSQPSSGVSQPATATHSREDLAQYLQRISPQDREMINQFPSLIGYPSIPSDSLNQAIPSSLNEVRRSVSTNLWEEEGTICLVVELNGTQVTRRCDNNMINGTKLLNSARITRGRRDGVLKGERFRHVVKVGAMNFKGVWIPFERALELARHVNVLEDLYPLFLPDLSPVIYSRQHYSRLRQQLAKGARRNPRFNDWIDGIPSQLGNLQWTSPQQPGSSSSIASTNTAPGRVAPPPETLHYQGIPSSRDYPAEVDPRRGPASDSKRQKAATSGSRAPGNALHPNLSDYSQKLRQAHLTRRHRRGTSMSMSISYTPPAPLPAHMTVSRSEAEYRCETSPDESGNQEEQ